MAKKKYLHVMELNSPLPVCEEFLYQYGNTKDIRLELSESGVRITFSFNKVYSKDDMLGYGKFYIFPDAIKKALLLYLVKYSKELDFAVIRLEIDGREEVIDVQDAPLVYSLVNGKLLRQMDPSFQNKAVLDGIVAFTKSKQDHRMASLFALLCSKSKVYEAERFIYLWMAFNGLYSFVGDKAADIRNLKSVQEAQGIGYLLALEGQTKARVYASDSKSIAQRVIKVLEGADDNRITRESLEHGIHTGLAQSIRSCLVDKNGNSIDITAYGYLLGFFSYYFRCNIIHASKPVPLFSYAMEYELRCLKIINDLLEDFLDANLHKFFLKSYAEGNLTSDLAAVINDPAIKMG